MKSRLPHTLLRPLSRPTPQTTLRSITRSQNLHHPHPQPPQLTQTRPLISAPTPTSRPLLSRRPDRALPSLPSSSRTWLLTAPLFLLLVGCSAAAIFNYEKSSSSVVSATLYSLRIHPEARKLLGDEIYFRDRWPWIWGELNQVHGRIDIGYGVKGTRGKGYMRFRAERRGRAAFFETREWTLEMLDGEREGEVLRLLSGEGEGEGAKGKGRDPFGKEVQEAS